MQHAEPVKQNNVDFFIIHDDLNCQTNTLKTLELPGRINSPDNTISTTEHLEHPDEINLPNNTVSTTEHLEHPDEINSQNNTVSTSEPLELTARTDSAVHNMMPVIEEDVCPTETENETNPKQSKRRTGIIGSVRLFF